MDFTLIGKNIQKTMSNTGEPLTENQYMVLQGALAAYQVHINLYGLENLLKSLAKNQ